MLGDWSHAEDFLQVVHVGELFQILSLDEFALDGEDFVVGSCRFIVEADVFLGRSHLGKLAVELDTALHIVGNAGIPFLTALGGDKDNAVGGT